MPQFEALSKSQGLCLVSLQGSTVVLGPDALECGHRFLCDGWVCLEKTGKVINLLK